MSELAPLPARPPSEVEWEDLLMRVEMMTRVLRITLEESDPASAAREMAVMVDREAAVAAWLEARSGIPSRTRGTENAANPAFANTWGVVDHMADRFLSLRARNFAMVQRRGLEVWDWIGAFGETGEMTAYQLFGWLVRRDVRSLETLRQGTAPAC